MMGEADGLTKALGAFLSALRSAAATSPNLRQSLRAVGEAVIGLAEPQALAESSPQPQSVVAAPPAVTPPPPPRVMPGRDVPGPALPVGTAPDVPPTLPPSLQPIPVVQTRLRIGDAIRSVAVVGTPEEARAA